MNIKKFWYFLQIVSQSSSSLCYYKHQILNLNFSFLIVIQVLGEQLKVKQQVISTAIVYFKRFYVRNSLRCIDPLLMAPTCIFLASKVEEFGVISNNRLINICQTVGKLYNYFKIKILIIYFVLLRSILTLINNKD